MYPTIVIVLVGSRRSFVDTYDFSTAFKSQDFNLYDPASRSFNVGNIIFALASPADIANSRSVDTSTSTSRIGEEDESRAQKANTIHGKDEDTR